MSSTDTLTMSVRDLWSPANQKFTAGSVNTEFGQPNSSRGHNICHYVMTFCPAGVGVGRGHEDVLRPAAR